jgi:hypothetical protein
MTDIIIKTKIKPPIDFTKAHKMWEKALIEDKIITTFETTITWVRPRDLLPNKNGAILIKIKGESIISTLFYDIEYGFKMPYSYNKSEIEWWAYFPEFD